MSTRVVNIKKCRAFGAYIGRKYRRDTKHKVNINPYANPFTVGPDGNRD